MNINWDKIDETVPDLHKFLENKKKICKCVKVIDGDTIKVVTDLDNQLWKITVRFAHVNAPELHSKDPIVKEKAIFVKNELTKKIFNKLITIKFGDQEKYGRFLGEVYLDDEYINKWLLDNNYAIKYDL